jgi:hypothetical protein
MVIADRKKVVLVIGYSAGIGCWGGGADLVRRATGLGAFAAVVTLAVHVPGGLARPVFVESEALWLWDILQRTNLVKNICLLGGCFHFLHHRLGKYSLARYLGNKR